MCGPENGQSPFSELFCRKVTPFGNFASEVLSPYLLRQQANVMYCTFHFGQQVVTPLQEDSDNRKRGFPKELVPFGKPLFLVELIPYTGKNAGNLLIEQLALAVAQLAAPQLLRRLLHLQQYIHVGAEVGNL